MTRTKQLPVVLNVRLDADLAAELARIARASALSQSEVARSLLGYGIDVWRTLEADELSRPFRPIDEDPSTR